MLIMIIDLIEFRLVYISLTDIAIQHNTCIFHPEFDKKKK